MDDLPLELDLVLKKKLKGEAAEIATISLREPSALDLEQAEGDLGLLARVSGIEDIAVLGQMAASDYTKATEYLAHFARLGQLIGKGPELLDPDEVPDLYALELLRPLTYRGETISVLDLAEPTAAQLQQGGAAGNWVTGNLMILQMMTKLPIGILRMMASRDFAKASEYMRFFSRPGQSIGNGSSPISVGFTAGDPMTAGT